MVFTSDTAEGSKFLKVIIITSMGSKRHQINNHSEIIHLTLFIVTDRKIITGKANPLSGNDKTHNR